MRKSMIPLALVLALVGGACAGDVTSSDEYRALEREVADLEQQVAGTAAQLVEAQAAAPPEVPAEVLALLDAWWAANQRRDGSVVDLYTENGYHLYGDTKFSRDDLAAHLQLAVDPTWITEPYLIAADHSLGRYVVTRGMRSGTIGSAVTFEVVTPTDGALKLAQTTWTYAHLLPR